MDQLNDDLSPERAMRRFKRFIDYMEELAKELVKTKAGRDSLRRDLDCGIEGFEDEDKEFFDQLMINSERVLDEQKIDIKDIQAIFNANRRKEK